MAEACAWTCFSFWQCGSAFPSFPENYANYLRMALKQAPGNRPVVAKMIAGLIEISETWETGKACLSPTNNNQTRKHRNNHLQKKSSATFTEKFARPVTFKVTLTMLLNPCCYNVINKSKNMPQIIPSLDQIHFQKQRSILFLEMQDCWFSQESDPIHWTQVIAWLEHNKVPHVICGPPNGPDDSRYIWISGGPKFIYIDLPYDTRSAECNKVVQYFENEKGEPKDQNAILYLWIPEPGSTPLAIYED